MKHLEAILFVATAIFVVESRPVSECGETGHGIVFDAGSSHTSMFIYNWPDNKTDGTGRVEEIVDCDVEGGGISDYVDDPVKAGESLEACLQQAMESIDEEDHTYTPVYLGSTAGMRLVEETNPVGSAGIFDSVREALDRSPFNFSNPDKQARIISGENEGIFGWVTTNYLSNKFKVAFSAFYFVIDALLETSTPTIADIDMVKNEHCEKSITEVMDMPKYNKYYLTYCFNIHYVRTLLIDGYGFDESNWNIEFVKKVNGVSVGWTMGYMIDATNRIPSEVDDCPSSASTNSLHVMFWSLLLTAIELYWKM